MSEKVKIGNQWFEVCPCCGKPKRPKMSPDSTPEEVATAIAIEVQQKGRWPSNFALVHKPPTALCPDCSGDGCEACDGRGVVGGCRRVGVKRVKGSNPPGPHPAGLRDGYHGGSEDPPIAQNYADPDGYECVTDWQCAEGCPARKLGEQSGERKSGSGNKSHPESNRYGGVALLPSVTKGDGKHWEGDSGTAARFYQQCGWEHERAEVACLPECPVAKLDEQAGERPRTGRPSSRDGPGGYSANFGGARESNKYVDSGGASRFYAKADWSHEIAERLATGDPVRYCPKAAKSERSKGLDAFYWRKDKQSPIGFTRITKDEWEALGEEEQRIKAKTGKRVSLRAQGNIHPTVKPISLLVWLCRLLSPPKEYVPRRLLIPFSGSGSEICAALISGCWEKVVGVELYQDHVDIAQARAAFWAAQPRQLKLQ